VAAHSSLLRASSKQADGDVDMRVVIGESEDPDGGVEQGGVLRRFVVALLKGSDAELEGARRELIQAFGPERAGQAARIVASFDGINRVADATGIRLDAEISGPAGQMIEELRLSEFLTE